MKKYYFNEEEDYLRIQAIFKVVALTMHRLTQTFDQITGEKYDELPSDIKDIFLAQLMIINVFTSMVKPITYEWSDVPEESAYEEWMKSNLRKIMRGEYESNDILLESEGTN